MSNYVKTTNFTAKDSLPTGDANKVIRGSEFDTEFNAIQVASVLRIFANWVLVILFWKIHSSQSSIL